jgi:hypothetical protein
MEILRVPPYDTTVSVSVGLPSTSYEVSITDMADLSSSVETISSSSSSKLSITLPSHVDGDYKIAVDGSTYFASIVRPYVDPNTKATTASEILEYSKHEELARAIIDSVIPDGFYFKKKIIQTSGLGSDYIPVWDNVVNILEVYENNVLVTDRTYSVTPDKTAITQSYSEALNRAEGAYNVLPMAASDLSDFQLNMGVAFPKTYDYTFVVEAGYENLPSDIVRAAELLIDDIACGKLDYYKRYIADYNTDQFKLKFDSRVFEGTGNILVDKILSKYSKPIKILGVL